MFRRMWLRCVLFVLVALSVSSVSLADNLVGQPDFSFDDKVVVYTYYPSGFTFATKYSFSSRFSIKSVGWASDVPKDLYIYKNGTLVETITTGVGSPTAWTNTNLTQPLYVSAGDYVTVITMAGSGGMFGWTNGLGFKEFEPTYYVDISLAYPNVEVASYQHYGPASTFQDNTPGGLPGVFSSVFFNLDVTPEPSPPTSTFVASPSDTWATTDVLASITAVDNAEVKEVHYKIGTAAESVVPGSSASFTLSQTGIYDITYFAVDNIDNLEAPKYATVRIDKVKPVSALARNAGLVSLSATDAHSGVSTIKYQVDNGAIQDYAGPISTSAETITYYAQDVAGNLEQQHVYSVAPGILSMSLSQSRIPGGIGVVGTVTLDKAAGVGGTVINLASSLPGVAVVDPTVTVPEGATTATFDIDANAVGVDTSVSITSTCDDTTQSTLLTVLAPTPVMVSWNASAVDGGSTATGTLIISGPAPTGGTTVALASSSLSALVTSSITIPAGAMTATFTVTTNVVSNDTSAVISATVYGSKLKSTLSILGPKVSSVTLAAASVVSLGTTTGTVTLSTNAPVGGKVVTLSSSNAGVASVPVSVTVAAGTKTATFPVTAGSVTANTAATITATTNSSTGTATVTVTPPAAAISGITTNVAAVTGGLAVTGTVTLTSAAPTGGAVIALASTPTAAGTVPASVTVAAGATSATFTITTKTVTAATTLTVTGTYLTVAKAVSITVNPARVVSTLTLNPTSVKGGTNSTGTITLTGVATEAVVVTLTSRTTTVATVPASVTVPAGASSATFPITTKTQTATKTSIITAKTGTTSKTATLTVTK